MAPVRKCRVPVRLIATARVPSFVALKTVIGLRVSTAARKNAKRMGVALVRVFARKMRVPVKMVESA